MGSRTTDHDSFTSALPGRLDVDALDPSPAVQPATPSRATAHPKASAQAQEPRNGKERTSLSSTREACPYLWKEPEVSKPSMVAAVSTKGGIGRRMGELIVELDLSNDPHRVRASLGCSRGSRSQTGMLCPAGKLMSA